MNLQIVELFEKMGTVEFWDQLFHSFQILGPFVPMLIAMVEAFIPALPLIAIVTLNVAAHGALLGFVYSWIGSVFGSILFFALCRKFFKPWIARFADKHPKIMKARNWVNTINKKALFLIITMPFTPSCFVNFAMGVSDFDAKTYIKIMAAAKIIMLILLSLFGQSVVQAFENPVFIVLAVLLVVVLYLVSRYIRKRHNLD